MMLRVFRVRAWCLVTAVVLAVGTTGASFDALLHGTVHDAGCAPISGAAHDAAAHRFEEGPEASPHSDGAHCLACHWARSFRPGVESTPVPHRLDDAGAHHTIAAIGCALAPAFSSVPARSPPPFA